MRPARHTRRILRRRADAVCCRGNVYLGRLPPVALRPLSELRRSMPGNAAARRKSRVARGLLLEGCCYPMGGPVLSPIDVLSHLYVDLFADARSVPRLVPLGMQQTS